eukprot:gene3795-4320_t
MFRKVKKLFGAGESEEKENVEGTSTRYSAESVHRFSSQYGNESSTAYSAHNLAGNSRRYPSYGDFTDAFVTRYYGEWWNMVPSTPLKFGRKETWFQATDFVDLYYSHAVLPTKIEIYETYNPGAVVRILACNKAPHESFIDADQILWEVLWEGGPVKTEHEARIFSPPINNISFPTRLIRLEFNQRLCEYYTELDAVYITGTTIIANMALQHAVEDSLAYLDISNLSLQETSSNRTGTSSIQSQVSVDEREACGYFQILPDEIIATICSHLTLKELILMIRSCKFFKAFIYDPSWYKELNLKPYWSKINNKALESFVPKCSGIEKLNMSWLGALESITTNVFIKFVEICGSSLTHLHLAACDFVNLQSLKVISSTCYNLIELNLSSCNISSRDGISFLKNLTKLQNLNLYRVPVHEDILIEIFRSCTQLKFVNLGSNTAIENGNLMLEELAKNCRNLRGLDLWRNRSINGQGINFLSEYCHNLMEIDFGWCSNIKSSRDSIVKLAKTCTKLKTIFLTAVRSVNNDDIIALAEHCPCLEQLDLLGMGEVNPLSIERLIENCKNLKLLDVSFCSRIIEANVIKKWRNNYPHISIKSSFTS